MSEIILTTPQTLIGWAVTILTTASAVIVIFSRIRKNDMDILRQSNEDLRLAHNDSQRQIDELKTSLQEMKVEIAVLREKKQTLENIVKLSLEEFFSKNPKKAFAVSKEFKK